MPLCKTNSGSRTCCSTKIESRQGVTPNSKRGEIGIVTVGSKELAENVVFRAAVAAVI